MRRRTSTFLSGYRAWRLQRRNRCQVTEEWCGAFIGRRHCATHNVAWDGSGPCPRVSSAPGIRPFAINPSGADR
jgi:hypothetical protein